jgi:hypothetical protein
MFKVIYNGIEQDFPSLDLAMKHAKVLNAFVTIRGASFELVGKFGVDSIVDGRCPDGVVYDWNKSSRIGRVKKEHQNPV